MKNIKEAISFIENRKQIKNKLNVDRIKNILKKYNNIEKELKVIHVAGTNGKGSTTNYINNILIENGFKVGMFTSPYMMCFNDRVRINNEFIKDSELLIYINKYYDDIVEFELSFFEIVTFISIMHFHTNKVDYCVFEVGLGGTLDSTNVFDNLFNIITNISLDHTHILGNTREEILDNKLGIVKNNTPIITQIDDNLLDIIKQKDNEIISIKDYLSDINKTKFKYKNKEYELTMLGYHQILNASLAIETCLRLEIDYEIIKKGLLKSTFAGRIEKVSDNPLIYLDGAHNTDSLNVLKNTLKEYYDLNKIHVLFASIKTKDLKLSNILNEFKSITFTTFDGHRVNSEVELYENSGHLNKNHTDDFAKYINNVKIEKDEIILITGSLYFISEVRKLYIKGE